MPYVTVEAGKLYYERAGEGYPVVLIHPALWDSRIWDLQFEPFAAQHDVVRYDVRGYGRSDVPTQPYSDIRDLRYLLGELGIERCALVGCSVGGQLAIDAALAHPDLVEALVLVAPGLSGYRWRDPGLEVLTEEVRRAVAAGDLEGAMDLELAVWAPLRSGPEVDAWVRRIAMENLHILRVPDTLAEIPPPALPRLAEIQAATLVIVGDRDIGEMHAIADVLVERVPGAHKREVHDADQLVMVRRPEIFNRLVLDFLAFRM
ncbi:MAG: hydrolase [Actinomycetota bacterium]|nr:MAG: hydrolase [Actinomycetota bacterium]